MKNVTSPSTGTAAWTRVQRAAQPERVALRRRGAARAHARGARYDERLKRYLTKGPFKLTGPPQPYPNGGLYDRPCFVDAASSSTRAIPGTPEAVARAAVDWRISGRSASGAPASRSSPSTTCRHAHAQASRPSGAAWDDVHELMAWRPLPSDEALASTGAARSSSAGIFPGGQHGDRRGAAADCVLLLTRIFATARVRRRDGAQPVHACSGGAVGNLSAVTAPAEAPPPARPAEAVCSGRAARNAGARRIRPSRRGFGIPGFAKPRALPRTERGGR